MAGQVAEAISKATHTVKLEIGGFSSLILKRRCEYAQRNKRRGAIMLSGNMQKISTLGLAAALLALPQLAVVQEAYTTPQNTDVGFIFTTFMFLISGFLVFFMAAGFAMLEAGMIWVNSENVRHLPTPFGGLKSRGIRRDGGDWSFEFYMEQKHIGFATGSHKISRLGA